MPKRVDGFDGRGYYGFQEKTGLLSQLARLASGGHPAARQTARYASQLLRVRHAPMLPNRTGSTGHMPYRSIVQRGFALYNQGDWRFQPTRQPMALNLHLYNRVAPEERGRTWKSV